MTKGAAAHRPAVATRLRRRGEDARSRCAVDGDGASYANGSSCTAARRCRCCSKPAQPAVTVGMPGRRRSATVAFSRSWISSNATMRTPASRVLAIPGKASALARRGLAPPSGREQKYRPDCRSGDNGEVTVAPRRPPASFQIGSVGPAAADSRILLWMQQSQGVDDVPSRVRPETDPHRPALRSPACGMSAIRGEGLPGWGNVSRRW